MFWSSKPLFGCLKDFEVLTPNLLARTIETVEGGGLIILLLRSLSSLTSLYTMVMVCVAFKLNCFIQCYLVSVAGFLGINLVVFYCFFVSYSFSIYMGPGHS